MIVRPSAGVAASKLSRRKLRFRSGVEFAEGKTSLEGADCAWRLVSSATTVPGSERCVPGDLSPETFRLEAPLEYARDTFGRRRSRSISVHLKVASSPQRSPQYPATTIRTRSLLEST